MKTIVISDTHLTVKFDQKKFDFLNKIISEADQIIINGDFWDAWLINLDAFLNSQWKPLFPLLLSKKTVYVHGNHDASTYCDERINSFCLTHTDEYLLSTNQGEYIFRHGHTLTKNKRSKLTNIYINALDTVEGKPIDRVIHKFLNQIGTYGFKLLGPNGIKKLGLINESNRIMKSSQRQTQNTWLICGDSHLPEVDDQCKYANSGCILQGHGSYLVIENERPQLHYHRY